MATYLHSRNLLAIAATVATACMVSTIHYEPKAGASQPNDGTESYLSCPGGVTVIEHIPPAGFNLVTATSDQLTSFGMAPRPDVGDVEGTAEWMVYATHAIDSLSSCPVPGDTYSSPAAAESTSPCNATYCSHNWSGHIVTGNTYSEVTGNWAAPTTTADSSHPTADASFWMGLGGFDSPELVQAGTEDDPGGPNYAWWEVVNDNKPQQSLPQEKLYSMNAGDHMYADVRRLSSGENEFIVDDLDTGQDSDVMSGGTDTPHGEAEWVAERDTFPMNGEPYFRGLANFGTVTFRYMSAASGGNFKYFSAWPHGAIDMEDCSDTTGLAHATPVYGPNNATGDTNWLTYGGTEPDCN